MKRTFFAIWFLFFVLANVLLGQTSEKTRIRVAQYRDDGVAADAETVFAPILAQDEAFELEFINGEQIRAGMLDSFDIFLLPGGSGLQEAKSMRPEGVEKVKAFIRSGKGFLGICAGAYFAFQQNLINAEQKAPGWMRGKAILKMEFSDLGRKLFGEKYVGEWDISYQNGPVMKINTDPEMPKCEVLAWFRSEVSENGTQPGIQIDSPAILLTTFGRGTVLVSSPHPEKTATFHRFVLSMFHHLADNLRFGKVDAAVQRTEEQRALDSKHETQRKAIVEAMRAMAEIEWVPKEDIVWYQPQKGVIFKAGEMYRGIPYTESGRLTNLEQFQALLDSTSGKPLYQGPTESKKYRGSDCSSACSYAWRYVFPQVPVLKTWDMEPGDFCFIHPETGKTEPLLLRVGDYSVSDFHQSQKVVEENGLEKMARCYDQLRPGDAVVRRPLGHVRLVSRVDTFRRTVYVIEQTGLNPAGKLKSEHQSWRVDYPFSYDALYRDGYLPVTLSTLP